jgi:hypothetical protein
MIQPTKQCQLRIQGTKLSVSQSVLTYGHITSLDGHYVQLPALGLPFRAQQLEQEMRRQQRNAVLPT